MSGIPSLVALQSAEAFLSNVSSLSLQHLSSAVVMAAAAATAVWEVAAFSVRLERLSHLQLNYYFQIDL